MTYQAKVSSSKILSYLSVLLYISPFSEYELIKSFNRKTKNLTFQYIFFWFNADNTDAKIMTKTFTL